MDMRSLVFLSLFLILASCSGQSRDQDGGDLTRSEVEYLQSRLATAIEAEFPVLQHKMVNRYVNSLGQSIVSRNPEMPPLPYEFRVLRSDSVMAFSLPGGLVYISLGAIRAADLEGQLAAAISHELAHQQLGHPLQVWRKRVNSNRGQRNLLDFEGPWLARFVGENGAIRLTPGMEEEADRLAPIVLYRGGVDPRLYTSYLQLLRKLETTAAERVAVTRRLHPPIGERLAWVKEVLLKLPPQKEASVSSQSFQEIKSILQEAAKRGTEKNKESTQ